ncbi:MAG: DUF885 domain-containing protein [Henriciella sp.]|nr:DUF885 domain-containing protein [Henriciella sp.]MBO6694167.1 DUF885 domain-containing protein [Henriciella sp.]
MSFSTLRIAALSCVLILAAPTVIAQSLPDLIDQYEVFNREGDPDEAARAQGVEPRIWWTVTPEHVEARAEQAAMMLDALNALETPEQGPETAILRHLLQASVDAHHYDTARIPFTGDWGFFAAPAYTAMRTRLTTRASAEAWTARVNDLPRFFDEQIDNMQRGVDTGWTQHGDPLATSIAQIRAQVVEDPTDSTLFLPFESLEASDLSQLDIITLRNQGKTAVQRAIDAYANLLEFMEEDYAPTARAEPGLASLEGGQAAYAVAVSFHTAGAGYSPEDIHQLGQSEVARIRAEMDKIIDEVEFEGSFDEFIAFLRSDPQFYAETPDELLEKAAEMSKRLDAILPRYFGTLPRLPYGVEAVPAAIAPGYTTGRYSGGDAEKGIAGTYLVNTYALDQRPLYELPALSAHEAVPGHHLQIALAQELEDVPEFRKSYYATAFGEGWGLYAEKLAGEAGFYRTPYERFGQLSYEMWRACRLVADTGLHHYGWSREEAEACFNNNTALAPLNIKTEVTRYIGWPGQATAYKIGELKILELRAKAKSALGEQFDIRAYHDVVLGAGAMPLDALESRVETWIASQLAESSAE